MSATCKLRCKDACFRLYDITGASFSLTGHGNDVTMTHSAEMHDVTTFGDQNRANKQGHQDFGVDFSGYYSGSGTGSAASKLHEIVANEDGTAFGLAPNGSSVADTLKYSGSVFLENLQVNFPAPEIATWSFTLVPRTGSLGLAVAAW